MNYAENEQQRQAMAAWLAARDFTVFGTLKSTDGTALHDAAGERLVRQFFCALDRTYYGNAVTNVGMRHNRIVFKHMGTSQANLHYHFLAKPHSDAALFAELAKKQWAKMSAWTMGVDDTMIGLVRNNRAASTYVLHEYGKLGADSICLSASSFSSPACSPMQYRRLPQLRRLLKLQSYGTDEMIYGAEDDDAQCRT
ncbi:MAG: hypothetical protein WBG95_05960 [Sulfitobacter sp.]